MKTVMSASCLAAPISGVMPECVKVESPIVHSTGNAPAWAAPCAIAIDAPMSTHVCTAS